MKKVGILSDKYYRENCLENQFLGLGIAQQMFPYIPSKTLSRPLKEKPVAQRGYEINRVARDIHLRTMRPYEEVLSILIEETKKKRQFDLGRVTMQVKQSEDQASLLAKSVKPRNNNFNQLERATIDPLTGNIVAKTGRLSGEELSSPEFRPPTKEYSYVEPEDRM